MNTIRQKYCSVCNDPFGCGNESDTKKCWSNDLPPIFTLDGISDCLCPPCLQQATVAKIEEYVATITPENAKDNKAKDLPKTTHFIENIDYYIENEKYVLTKWFHLKRGNCCENGCRHCPYGFKKNKK